MLRLFFVLDMRRTLCYDKAMTTIVERWEAMSGERKQNIKVTLTAGTADVWRRAARDLGVVTTSGGPMQGRGNLSGMLELIAGVIASGEMDLSLYIPDQRTLVQGELLGPEARNVKA